LVADIDDAVSKKHTQNTDQKLDESGINEVSVIDVKNAVDNRHEKNIDEEVTVVNYDVYRCQVNNVEINCFILYNGVYYAGCNTGYVSSSVDGIIWNNLGKKQPNSKNINWVSEYNGILYFVCNDGYILTFDGTTWTSTLVGVSGRHFNTSIVYSSILYIADSQGYVFEYNGATWSNTRRGGRSTNCVEVYNGILYFGENSGYIFTFDGTTWTTEVKRELNSKYIYTPIVYNSKLYFGCSSGYILIFDGTTWSSLQGEPNGKQIYSSGLYNGNIYFGCLAGYILKYDGVNWYSKLRQTQGHALVSCLALGTSIGFGTNSVTGVSGGFIGIYSEEVKEITTIANDIIDLQSKSHYQNTDTLIVSQDWEILQSTGYPIDNYLSGVIVYNDKIYGAYWTGTYPNYTTHILEFNGMVWSEVYSILNFQGTIGSLIYHNRLYFFFSAVAVSFDGTTWSSAVVTVHGKATMPILYNDKLYWAGNEGCVVELNDTVWTELGVVTTPNPYINSGAVYDGILYLGCDGGYVMEFNGAVWSIAQREPNGWALASEPIVYNNTLYFGCRMLIAPYQTYILEFDGTTWSSVLREANLEYNIPAGIYANKLYWKRGGGSTSEIPSYLIFDGTNYTVFIPNLSLVGYGLSKFLIYNNLTYAVAERVAKTGTIPATYLVELDKNWLCTSKLLHIFSGIIEFSNKLYLIYTDGYFETYQDIKIEDIQDAIDNSHDGTIQLSKNSISGTFTTVDGKTIAVVDGQITDIT
jgi:hypothetical protein